MRARSVYDFDDTIGVVLHARRIIAPGAGHVPTMTRPRDVADEIQAFSGIDRLLPVPFEYQ